MCVRDADKGLDELLDIVSSELAGEPSLWQQRSAAVLQGLGSGAEDLRVVIHRGEPPHVAAS
jgi:hypothetical protein